MQLTTKIVKFDEYCSKCIYRDYDEEMNPCYDCLTETTNVNTDQPVSFKEGKAKILKTRKGK